MIKKLAMAALAAAFLLPASQAGAADQTGVYIAPKFVLNIQHAKGELSIQDNSASDSKTAARAGGALAVGYDFSKSMSIPARAELEYGIYGRASKTSTVDGISMGMKVGFQTLLVNAYYDIGTYSGFTPYVGAGLGMAFLKTESSITSADYPGIEISGSDTKAVFAGQLGLGCAYAITDYASVDLGYRFLMMGNGKASLGLAGIDFVDAKSKNNYAHQFMLGLRFTF